MDTILEAFYRSDPIGQTIIWVLVAASAFAWSIAFYKIMEVRETKRMCKKFHEAFRKCGDSPLQIGQQFMGTRFEGPLKEICVAGITELLTILAIPQNEQRRFFQGGRLPRKLTPDEIDKIRASMNRIANEKATQIESNMTILATIINLSPMLGLFGTVWGVMETFIGLVKQGKADIIAIAPGVSGALLTTVAGLLVAVPMILFNNLVSADIGIIYREIDIFIEEFISSMRLEETMHLNDVAAQPAQQQPNPAWRRQSAEM